MCDVRCWAVRVSSGEYEEKKEKSELMPFRKAALRSSYLKVLHIHKGHEVLFRSQEQRDEYLKELEEAGWTSAVAVANAFYVNPKSI